jgi:hypothetical protein
MSKSEKYTAKVLGKHNVVLARNGFVLCRGCGNFWRPKLSSKGLRRRGFWRCKNGCNTKEAVSKTDNSSGEHF